MSLHSFSSEWQTAVVGSRLGYYRTSLPTVFFFIHPSNKIVICVLIASEEDCLFSKRLEPLRKFREFAKEVKGGLESPSVNSVGEILKEED